MSTCALQALVYTKNYLENFLQEVQEPQPQNF